MKNDCAEEGFLSNVEEHEINIIRNDGVNRHTFHYVWCLYAIAWGIQKFDEVTNR